MQRDTRREEIVKRLLGSFTDQSTLGKELQTKLKSVDSDSKNNDVNTTLIAIQDEINKFKVNDTPSYPELNYQFIRLEVMLHEEMAKKILEDQADLQNEEKRRYVRPLAQEMEEIPENVTGMLRDIYHSVQTNFTKLKEVTKFKYKDIEKDTSHTPQSYAAVIVNTCKEIGNKPYSENMKKDLDQQLKISNAINNRINLGPNENQTTNDGQMRTMVCEQTRKLPAENESKQIMDFLSQVLNKPEWKTAGKSMNLFSQGKMPLRLRDIMKIMIDTEHKNITDPQAIMRVEGICLKKSVEDQTKSKINPSRADSSVRELNSVILNLIQTSRRGNEAEFKTTLAKAYSMYNIEIKEPKLKAGLEK